MVHNSSHPFHFETLAIHAASESDQHQAINPPLYLTSSFDFTDIEQCDDTFSFRRKAYVYTRGGNPTINLFEKRMAALEGGTGAVAFASGMAAVSTVLLSFLHAGDRVVAHNNLYGSTFNFLNKVLPRYNIQTHFHDLTALDDDLEQWLEDAKVIFFETPTNPSLAVIDIIKVVELARKYGCKVIVDNTFATPYLQKPLSLGADVVVHSATKYISGHGDVVAGVAIAADEEYIHRLKFDFMCEFGGVMSPFNAFLLLRGLKTLAIRMQQHTKNAQALANFLVKQPLIERVIYPGLSHHPQHDVATQQMKAYGGVVSFELQGDADKAQNFLSKLSIPKLAVSLGDAETLIQIPALMTHRSYPESELSRFGFTKKTIRVSLGLEDTDDLMADFEQALLKI